MALAGLAPLATTPLMAQQDSYYYGGLSVGHSRNSLDDDRMANSLVGGSATITGITHDRGDTGYKLFGGYQFNRYLGMELGGFELGRFSFGASTTPTGQLDTSYSVRGLNLDVVGTLPLVGNLSAIGRVGAIRTRTRSNFAGSGAVQFVEPDRNRSDTSYKLGAGLQYAFSPGMQMRAEVERYRVSDALSGHGHVNLVSLSLVFPFGRGSAPMPRAAAPAAMPVAYAPPMPAAAPPPPPVAVMVVPPPAPVTVVGTAPPPPVQAPARRRSTYSAESLFGFDRSALQPAGRTALDGLVRDLEGADYSVVTVEGHADRIGGTAYNQQLSLQRAQAVGNYLVATGRVDASKINIVGKGESTPVTEAGSCKGETRNAELVICLQPDRRVEIEVVGLR